MPSRVNPQLRRSELWLRTKLTALSQWGLITREQLLIIGHTPAEIRTLLRQGRLEVVERGVFGLPGYSEGWESRLFRHVLKTGGRASHLSAALLWELADAKHLRVGYAEVRVGPTSRPARRDRLKVYRSDREPLVHNRLPVAPPAEERSGLLGPDGNWIENPDHPITLRHPPGTRCRIPCTDLDQTLIDVGRVHGPEQFLQCFAEAVRRSLIDTDSIVAAAAVFAPPGTRGRRKLLDAIEQLQRHSDALSGWSYLAAVRIEDHGLPRPELEAVLHTADGRRIGQVDLWWPQFRLVVELDGRDAHRTADAFETDRRRDALLSAEGITVLRFTWAQFQQGSYFVDTIARTMAHRRAV